MASLASMRLPPTANLLRNSRLFSLPPPLPRPPHLLTSKSSPESDTATLVHPTHAAIVTPPSSLVRGDWGIKRNLPLQSTTRTSTPVLRIKAQDTFEHITEFESAADHVLTLHKWQEMNIPFVVPSYNSSNSTNSPWFQHSVFDAVFDNTHIDKETTPAIKTITATNTQQQHFYSPSQDKQRWKFRGPWLAAKTEGEFQKYLKTIIRHKRSEFRQFLKQKYVSTKYRSERMKAMEAGREPPARPSLGSAGHDAAVSEEELTSYIKTLRQNPVHLMALVHQFLDLPTVLVPPISHGMIRNSTSETGSTPPLAHPSLGLSYIRTNAHLHNHPILGPQQLPNPVQARVLQPAHMTGRYGGSPLVGVAGTVTLLRNPAVNEWRGTSGIHREEERNLQQFDPLTPGGAKVYVHPMAAITDGVGRVRIRVEPAQKESIEVMNGDLEKEGPPKFEDPSHGQRNVPYLLDGYEGNTVQGVERGIGWGAQGEQGYGPSSSEYARTNIKNIIGRGSTGRALNMLMEGMEDRGERGPR